MPKYYMQPSTTLENGPGGKPITIAYEKQAVSEEAFFKHIDDFINETDFPELKKKQAKENVVAMLHTGSPVTIDDYTLSIKK